MTKIQLEWGGANGFHPGVIDIDFTPDKIAEHREDYRRDVSEAIRAALGAQLGATAANNGHLSSSIVILDAKYLQQQLAEAQAEAKRKEVELSSFRALVVDVATEYGERHGWCATVNDALAELGLEPPSSTYSFTVHLEFEVTADCTKRRDLNTDDSDDVGWVRESVKLYQIEQELEKLGVLDDDWAKEDLGNVKVHVTDLVKQ